MMQIETDGLPGIRWWADPAEGDSAVDLARAE